MYSMFMNEKYYFLKPTSIKQKQYEALRDYIVNEIPAKEVANKFGYTFRAFTSLVANFRKQKKDNPDKEIFFQVKKPGRKEMQQKPAIVSKVIELRKAYLSVPDIKVILDGKNIKVSEKRNISYCETGRIWQVATKIKKRKANHSAS